MGEKIESDPIKGNSALLYMLTTLITLTTIGFYHQNHSEGPKAWLKHICIYWTYKWTDFSITRTKIPWNWLGQHHVLLITWLWFSLCTLRFQIGLVCALWGSKFPFVTFEFSPMVLQKRDRGISEASDWILLTQRIENSKEKRRKQTLDGHVWMLLRHRLWPHLNALQTWSKLLLQH